MVLKFKTENFDFEKIFNSGLFYFFYEDKPHREVLYEGLKSHLYFYQRGNTLFVDVKGEIDSKYLRKRISYCFGLEEDLEPFYRICRKDRLLKKFFPKIKNSRIVSAFSDFEALVGAIVSQNNSYANYRKQMRRLYENLNFERKKYLSDLRKFGVGYKSVYLMNLAKNFESIPLSEISGIGKYSIGLFRIFQERDYTSFYVDCLTEKIMRENYGVKSDFEEKSRQIWGDWRGLALAFLQRFFEKKETFH